MGDDVTVTEQILDDVERSQDEQRPSDSYLADLIARTLRLHDRREPKVIEVVVWIGTGVIKGSLPAEADLNSVELAKRFGTSRTPIRDALMILEREGLVEMLARKRPRVAAITAKDIADIYEVRGDLLARLARLVVVHSTESNLREVQDHLGRLRDCASAGDVDGYFYAHVALQERLAEIASNGVLKQILDTLALRTLVLRHRSIRQPGRLQASLADQERLVEAFVARDAD